jgi:zeaxanthin glucosyltransferase
MAHFGVVAPAFFSHFKALQPLAAALVARGHRVTFIHRPDAAPFIGDARIGFHAVGAATHPPGSLDAAMRRAADPGGPLRLRRVIHDLAGNTDMLCRELPDAIRTLGVDAIIADQMEAAGGLVAEGLGLPFVSVACALPVNREPGIPLPVMPFAWEDSERARRIVEGSTRVYDWMMTPHRRVIEAHAQRFGLGYRGALHDCLSPLAQISQTVEEFDFPRRALPAHFHHVGPLRPVAGVSGPDPYAHAMPDPAPGRPFIFASLGTMQGGRFGLFRRIAKACRRLDAQLLVAHCGGLDASQEDALRRAGATWVCAFAPQQAVLERADAVVSHAGLNTVLDAIAAGTPMLGLPIAFDHPGGAARMVHIGAGLRASYRFATVGTIEKLLRRLLADRELPQRLKALSGAVARAGGTARAADIVEAALGLDTTAQSQRPHETAA